MKNIFSIQGWIKGVNSETLDPVHDMGLDGDPTNQNNPNLFSARDAMGYSLNYFDNDYTAITQATFLAGKSLLTNLATDAPGLYNGNISSMVTSITDIDPTSNSYMRPLPQIAAYKYDQLNRIKQMKTFADMDFSYNRWNGTTWTDRYLNTIAYDANGNITKLLRNDAGSNRFDSLTYHYFRDGSGKLIQNRLYQVNDNATLLSTREDFADPGQGFDNTSLANVNTLNNFSFDDLGNLEKDEKEGIEKIEWNVYGKVKSITRLPNFTKTFDGTNYIYPSDLEYEYDPFGNRIAKIEKTRDANGLKDDAEWIKTYYVRDAQGNVMAMYKKSYPNETASFKLTERPIYGSSRLGTENTQIEYYSLTSSSITSHKLGLKQYELSNHLGNVLSTISDRKIAVDGKYDFVGSTNGDYSFIDGAFVYQSTGGPWDQVTAPDATIDYYLADIVSATDYFPFGMPMPGRNFNSSKYNFGHNTQEKDNEIFNVDGSALTAEYWEYDARLGRRWNIEPLFKRAPYWSPYSTFANGPIDIVDIDGNWPGWIHARIIREAFKGILSDKEIERLITASVQTDVDQDPAHSYKHSMTDGTGREPQSLEVSKQLRSNFISLQINRYINSGYDDGVDNGLLYLGEALHSISDEDAPSHNWLPWFGITWNPQTWLYAVGHFFAEVNVFHISEESVQASVQKVRTAYFEAQNRKMTSHNMTPMKPIKPIEIPLKDIMISISKRISTIFSPDKTKTDDKPKLPENPPLIRL